MPYKSSKQKREYMLEYNKINKKDISRKCKLKRNKLKTLGKCVFCGKKIYKNLTICLSCREKQQKRAINEKYNNTEQYLFRKAKNRAKLKNVKFDIDINDIKIPKYCPILKIKLSPNNINAKENSPSVDRIIPEKGYIKGNIQVISMKANTMKNDASKKYLINFAKWIYKNFKVRDCD